MPVACLLERLLNAPAIMIPMGQSSDHTHLANERIRRSNLFRGKNVIRHLLEEVAAWQPEGSGGTAVRDAHSHASASSGLRLDAVAEEYGIDIPSPTSLPVPVEA